MPATSPTTAVALMNRGSIESSLIMNRVSTYSSTLNSTTTPKVAGFDSSILALELKRAERRRNWLKHKVSDDEDFGLATSNTTSSTQHSQTHTQKSNPDFEKKKFTEVKDTFGNVKYRRGEKEVDRYARELDQWIKKMKCSGVTGMRLECFRDIKVGVCSDEVKYKAPSWEPYPTLLGLSYKFKGGRDGNGKFKGKGYVEFENGDCISGYFVDGLRQGECRVETNKDDVRVIVGQYANDKLNGRAKITFENDNVVDGWFKNGVLHGFARYFDEKGRLTFLGNHKNGVPVGVCWKVIRGGGCVVGRVDVEGKLNGIRVAYLFPDYKTAFVGTFTDGVMDFAQEATLKACVEDRGIKIPIFTEPDGRLYKREISTQDFVTSNPLLRDPYESKTVEVKPSRVNYGGDGLFARVKIEPNTVLAFYNGKRIGPKNWKDFQGPDWVQNAYKIFDPKIKNGTIDIPKEYWKYEDYNATSAHKVNHSFLPNAEFVSFDHPRFGVIPCVTSTHDIEAGEEIYVHYGYDLVDCPEWYEEAWQKGTYPVPDSMKDGYDGNPNMTNDDKANQLPENEQNGESTDKNGTAEA